MTINDLQFTPERWQQVWHAFKGEPQQLAGIEELRQAIVECNPVLMDEGASWVANFHKDQPKPALKMCIVGVPYWNQLLMDDGQGWRDCFSATCAMIAGSRKKCIDENAYNHIRQKHGDSTDPNAQVAALAELGLKANYSTTGNRAKLEELLDLGVPVGCGILHHGQASSPTGGGHWMLIVGYDDNGVIALDPYGELDVVNGTWAQQGSGGDHVHYSWKNWLPRWEVAGNDGYYIWVG
jgi:hypothetical protein